MQVSRKEGKGEAGRFTFWTRSRIGRDFGYLKPVKLVLV